MTVNSGKSSNPVVPSSHLWMRTWVPDGIEGNYVGVKNEGQNFNTMHRFFTYLFLWKCCTNWNSCAFFFKSVIWVQGLPMEFFPCPIDKLQTQWSNVASGDFPRPDTNFVWKSRATWPVIVQVFIVLTYHPFIHAYVTCLFRPVTLWCNSRCVWL